MPDTTIHAGTNNVMVGPPPDIWVARITLTALGATAIFGLGIIGYLAAVKLDIPQSITAIVSVALGALSGLVSTLFGRAR